MPKRYGRTLVSEHAASQWRYDQMCRGSDHADLAGNCQSPVYRSLTGYADKRLHQEREITKVLQSDPFVADHAPGVGFVDAWGRPISAETSAPVPVHVDLAVRCRKCPACLRSRAWHWQKRAEAETAASKRTWFGTLTLGPEAQFQAGARAILRLRDAGTAWEQLTPSEQFSERVREISPDLTRYLKRVRKQSGASIRYILVAEAHKSGLPHFHALIHEADSPVRHAILSNQWGLGFSNWKLTADARTAGYVCKYLAKSALARVRASVAYGASSTREATEPDGCCGAAGRATF